MCHILLHTHTQQRRPSRAPPTGALEGPVHAHYALSLQVITRCCRVAGVPHALIPHDGWQRCGRARALFAPAHEARVTGRGCWSRGEMRARSRVVAMWRLHCSWVRLHGADHKATGASIRHHSSRQTAVRRASRRTLQGKSEPARVVPR